MPARTWRSPLRLLQIGSLTLPAAIIGISRYARYHLLMALEQALHRYHIRQLEEQDAAGYIRISAQASETEEWVTEQSWEDEWNGVR